MIFRLFLSLATLLLASNAPAQFRVHSWLNFEEPALPSALTAGHEADNETVRVFPFNQAPAIIPSEPVLQQELGNRGLLFQTDDVRRHLTVYDSLSLDRTKLGASGQALYQADFFLPAAGEPIPNVSLLAAVKRPDQSASYSFYRFGIKAGGDSVFFTFADDSSSEPLMYYQQPISELDLKRPGWHRFQIVFTGQNQIECVIDGKKTSFSPITENTHKVLSAGMMITSSEPRAQALVDNLSIQWTNQKAPLPISPWDREASNRAQLSTGSPFDSNIWMNDPSKAWALGQSWQKPVLVFFYAPQSETYQNLLKIHPNGANPQSLFSDYVAVRVNTNQLNGGRLAQKFGIYRIPSFMIMNTDGSEKGRLIYNPKTSDWNEISEFLK